MVTPQILKGGDQSFQNVENIYEPSTKDISSMMSPE
jgi:hypothetical protein